MSTDTTTTLLRQTEARQAEREANLVATSQRVGQEWRSNPEDTARRILMDAGLKDEGLLEVLVDIATRKASFPPAPGALQRALHWYEVDQRMGDDDD